MHASLPTRGTTRAGRLKRLDALVCHLAAERMAAPDGSVFIDVGVGAEPHTTVEAARQFRTLDPSLVTVGIESDPERVPTASVGDVAVGVRWVCGGFDAVAAQPEPARLIRVLNVLRGYPPQRASPILSDLGEHLAPDGLLLEGSCGRTGDIGVVSLFRSHQGTLRREAVALYTDFGSGFAPPMFYPWLPRDLRRGEAVEDFLVAWSESVRRVGVARQSARERFMASVHDLARTRSVAVDPWLLARGVLVWLQPLTEG